MGRAATPRYGTEMRGRFRGGAETVSAGDLPVSLRGALRIMAGFPLAALEGGSMSHYEPEVKRWEGGVGDRFQPRPLPR